MSNDLLGALPADLRREVCESVGRWDDLFRLRSSSRDGCTLYLSPFLPEWDAFNALAVFAGTDREEFERRVRRGGPHILDLSHCDKLTNVSALEGCIGLHTVNLFGCNKLTNVSALKGCIGLHTLNLSYCVELTDVSALEGCIGLRLLDLSYCDKLADASTLCLATWAGLRIIR